MFKEGTAATQASVLPMLPPPSKWQISALASAAPQEAYSIGQ